MAADLLRSVWHSLEDPVVRPFQAAATTERLVPPLWQSRLGRWMWAQMGPRRRKRYLQFFFRRSCEAMKTNPRPPVSDKTTCPQALNIIAIHWRLWDSYKICLCFKRYSLSNSLPKRLGRAFEFRTKLWNWEDGQASLWRIHFLGFYALCFFSSFPDDTREMLSYQWLVTTLYLKKNLIIV